MADPKPQLAKKVPSAGGLYAYVTEALGPIPGFFVGAVFLCFEPLVAPLLFLIFAWATTDVFRADVGWDRMSSADDDGETSETPEGR